MEAQRKKAQSSVFVCIKQQLCSFSKEYYFVNIQIFVDKVIKSSMKWSILFRKREKERWLVAFLFSFHLNMLSFIPRCMVSLARKRTHAQPRKTWKFCLLSNVNWQIVRWISHSLAHTHTQARTHFSHQYHVYGFYIEISCTDIVNGMNQKTEKCFWRIFRHFSILILVFCAHIHLLFCSSRSSISRSSISGNISQCDSQFAEPLQMLFLK